MINALQPSAPRLADWGYAVTICIAAMAEKARSFVFCSDRKVSFGEFSADRAVFKFEPIMERTVVLVAGNDVARARTILQRTKEQITQGWIRNTDVIADTLFKECNAERDRIIEASVLRRRGFTWEMYKQGGKNICTTATYYEIQSEIAEVRLSLDFMVAGYDQDEKPHIRFTNWYTPPENYDDLGFYAIGSGATAAMSYLAHAVEYLHFNRNMRASEVLYHVLAAKFTAESAQDVGKDTFACVAKGKDKGTPAPDAPIDCLLILPPFADVEFIRERWEKEGAPRVPKKIGEIIEELLVTPQDAVALETLQKSAKHYARAKRALAKWERQWAKIQAEKANKKPHAKAALPE